VLKTTGVSLLKSHGGIKGLEEKLKTNLKVLSI
jgi:hypothetical protein